MVGSRADVAVYAAGRGRDVPRRTVVRRSLRKLAAPYEPVDMAHLIR
jgi:hypothetical protein